MSALTVSFMGALTYAHPWLLPVLDEHLVDQDGEVLPHLLMADVERWAEREIVGAGRDSPHLRGLLSFLEAAFGTHHDDEIGEVVSASFLEHLPRPGERAGALRELVGPLCAERLELIG